MQPLTLDDLLPLDEFAGRRRELFDAHRRYLDRCRRVRLGPRLTLVFENRQTLWFRVQDVLRVARMSEGPRVQDELDLYNRLLPAGDRLQAALIVAVANDARLSDELAPFHSLSGADLRLHLGSTQLPADLLTCRPEDRTLGAAHWVQFVVDESGRRLLADRRTPAHFTVALAAYRHESPPLSDDVRQSLVEDLG